ncbi:hypothetical protein [Streptomyces sp. enrichment culture]|uniref:hypothetical protein n=1 Tax=Streptomyces sp. enrichment culture TaxID=1795815 RepID=UPI003F5540E8
MDRRGRAFRFTVVSALAVLALTGFSSGRGNGGGHGGDGGGGGGCSSSGQDHDGSSSSSGGGGGSYRDHDDDDDYGSDGTGGTGGGSSRSHLRDAEAEPVSCATTAEPYAVVEVTNPNARGGTFRVRVDFTDDETHRVLDPAYRDVTLSAAETRTVEVPFDGSTAALDHCEVVPEAAPVN